MNLSSILNQSKTCILVYRSNLFQIIDVLQNIKSIPLIYSDLQDFKFKTLKKSEFYIVSDPYRILKYLKNIKNSDSIYYILVNSYIKTDIPVYDLTNQIIHTKPNTINLNNSTTIPSFQNYKILNKFLNTPSLLKYLKNYYRIISTKDSEIIRIINRILIKTKNNKYSEILHRFYANSCLLACKLG
jgi:hypothetical protein